MLDHRAVSVQTLVWHCNIRSIPGLFLAATGPPERPVPWGLLLSLGHWADYYGMISFALPAVYVTACAPCNKRKTCHGLRLAQIQPGNTTAIML